MIGILLAIATASLISYAIIIIGVAALLFIVFKLGHSLIKVVFGIMVNSILGIIALLLLNDFFHLGIALSIPVVVASAIFGLPGVGTIVTLKLLGATAI